MEQSQERVKSGVIETVGKAGPEGKQSIKAWINGLNSHALAHPTSYVFTHINYPQGLTPFFTASLELIKKINPTDPRNKSVGIPSRMVLDHLIAIRPCPGLSRGRQAVLFTPHMEWHGTWGPLTNEF